MYVIKKGNLYVAKPGRSSSYTPCLQKAQTFASEDAAKRCKCGNEYVVPVIGEFR